MHYKNGREAKVGDFVIGKVYNDKGPVAGKVTSLSPGTNTCNCNVAVIGDAVTPVRVEYSQCDWLIHAEDAWNSFMTPVAAQPPSLDVLNTSGAPAVSPVSTVSESGKPDGAPADNVGSAS